MSKEKQEYEYLEPMPLEKALEEKNANHLKGIAKRNGLKFIFNEMTPGETLTLQKTPARKGIDQSIPYRYKKGKAGSIGERFLLMSDPMIRGLESAQVVNDIIEELQNTSKYKIEADDTHVSITALAVN